MFRRVNILIFSCSIFAISFLNACSSISLQPLETPSCDSARVSTQFCTVLEDLTVQQKNYVKSAKKRDFQNQALFSVSTAAGVAAASAIGFEGNSDLITGTALAVGFSGPLRENLNLSQRAQINASGANALACVIDNSRALTFFNHSAREAALNSAADDIEAALQAYRRNADLVRSGSLVCGAGATATEISRQQQLVVDAQDKIAAAEAEGSLVSQAAAELVAARSAANLLPRLPSDLSSANVQINSTILTRSSGALPNLEQLIDAVSNFRIPEEESDEDDQGVAPAIPLRAAVCPGAPDVVGDLRNIRTKLRAVQRLHPSVINQAAVAISRCPLRAVAAQP